MLMVLQFTPFAQPCPSSGKNGKMIGKAEHVHTVEDSITGKREFHISLLGERERSEREPKHLNFKKLLYSLLRT